MDRNYGLQGQGVAGGAIAPKQTTELGDILGHLNQLAKRIDNAANNIAGSLDRIHGTRPVATEANPQATVATNTLSEMRDRLQHLERIAGWLDDSAQRLGSIV